MYLQDELKKRNVPGLLNFADGTAVTADNWESRRLELVDILAREEYGYSPEPAPVSASVTDKKIGEYAGKADYYRMKMELTLSDGRFSFPVKVVKPHKCGKFPVFVHINFRPELPDTYNPTEEIIDRGYALAVIYYNDISRDENDGFVSGVAPLYDRAKYNWGKIGMWAWSMSRVIDWLFTQDWVDTDNIAAIGHSRLGKTALWCGANDTRVKYTISNDSGCSGAAITRCKTGEHVAQITHNFPMWFCERYLDYVDREDAMPFEQNFLVAACAPRHVIIGSAVEDSWADPYSEMLSAVSASGVYEMLGLKGLVCEDREPVPGDVYHDGMLGYHLRSGSHYLSREDWNRYMDYIDKYVK